MFCLNLDVFIYLMYLRFLFDLMIYALWEKKIVLSERISRRIHEIYDEYCGIENNIESFWGYY